MVADKTLLERFHDIMVAADLSPPHFDQWILLLGENFELWPIEKFGVLVGGVLFVGHSLHIAVLPEWRGLWITKTMLKAFRAWNNEVDLYATPKADNQEAIELLTRLGFKFEKSQGEYLVYVKETKCRSH